MYYNIVPRLSQFSYRWDSAAQAPYLEGKDLNTFVSFEDERSVEQKARYILWKRLAGAIVWDLTGDYLEDPVQKGKVARTPLADMLAATLCGEVPIIPEVTVEVPAVLSLRPLHIRRKMFAPRITEGLYLPQKKEPRKRRGRRRSSS
jgi:GH18 family chitinase